MNYSIFLAALPMGGAGSITSASHVQVARMLTSRAKYALRASVAMAEQYPTASWTSASELAETADVPKKFLEAILTQLREQGLVESRRGPAGGHRLTADPANVTVADVIRSIDGPLAMTPCASLTAFRACDDCVDIETCRLRHIMRRARDAAADVLEKYSLADILANTDSTPTPHIDLALVPPLGL